MRSVGEPLYPALRIPMRVTDLAVVEQGTDLDITFTIPPQTTEGLPLKEIGGVELRVGPNPNNNAWNAERVGEERHARRRAHAGKPGPGAGDDSGGQVCRQSK